LREKTLNVIQLSDTYMIDTIVLTLTKDMYHVSEPDRFQPSAKWVDNLNYKIRGIQSKQNPTKKELVAGIYKPRLTIAHRMTSFGNQITLKIELSLPKLIFGNNFDELRFKDFKTVVDKLVDILKEMGVVVTPEVLTKAPISVIHYSKNIPLTDGSTPYHFINKIKEANIKLSLDVNQTDYRNEGHSYKWHCNTYEVVFYDKIKDLEKAKHSSKRCLEKDSDLQLNIFNSLKNPSTSSGRAGRLEILRFEVRLNNRKKIKQLFKTLNIKSDLTFKSLFKPAISKKILSHYLDELESKRSVLIDFRPVNDKALLSALILNNPDLGPTKIIQMFGLKKIFETINTRELRVMFSSFNKGSWYRLMNEANKVKLPIKRNSFDAIRECINKFKPLKIGKN